MSEVLWRPADDLRTTTVMGRFLTQVEQNHDIELANYPEFHEWSINNLREFWKDLADFSEIIFHEQPRSVLGDGSMQNVRWFEGSTLNYAEHCLRGDNDEIVLICHSEVRDRIELTRGQLQEGVIRARNGLIKLGVGPGDRVAAYLPSGAEAVIGLLATASLGAIWTSCAPEFGTENVVDKLSQVEPKVLLAADGYSYRGRQFNRLTHIEEIAASLPSLKSVVLFQYLNEDAQLDGSITWDEFTSDSSGPLTFNAVPFDHPLYILYSSGTTGKPKAIVHSHGPILLEHYKLLYVHDDIQPGDRFFWFSSTGWMAWNLGVSALLCGATVVMLDGDPMYPSLEHYWKVLAQEKVSYLGVSPAFLLACKKQGVVPKEIGDLSSLRTINVGGSPLSEDGFHWVYDNIHRDLYLQSASGGTDIASSFVGGTRLVPVVAGRIACKLLGVAAYAFDDLGQPVVNGQGELTITEPMPTMPAAFWGDDGSRVSESYFERFPGVWCHGDWITFFEDESCIVSGRSDATLNRGGVRIGSSEFYSVIEEISDIADSLVVHLEDDEGGFGELILFVQVRDAGDLTEALQERIREQLRNSSSPRHVPDTIIQVPVIPRTHSAKKMEVPVKRLLQGINAEQIVSQSSVLIPGSLDWFVEFAAERKVQQAVQPA